MNKTAKLIISIISFVIALVFIVITFFDFILICGKWDMSNMMMGATLPDGYTPYLEFCFGGEVKAGVEGSGISVSDDLVERLEESYDGMSYKFENGKLSIVEDGGSGGGLEGMPYKVTESTLELCNPDPDADPTDEGYKMTLDRIGLSLAWILRIVGGVFLIVGVVFLIIPAKKKAPAAPAGYAPDGVGGYTYGTTSYAPTYDAPAAPTYTAPTAPEYAAPAAPAYEAPAYTAPAAPEYAAPAAPAYETPAYTAPAASEYTAPAAPTYAPPAMDGYVPADLPKSVRTSDSDRFKTAGDL